MLVSSYQPEMNVESKVFKNYEKNSFYTKL